MTIHILNTMTAATDRLQLLSRQIKPSNFLSSPSVICPSPEGTLLKNRLLADLKAAGITDIEVEEPPRGCEKYFSRLLTQQAVKFIADLVCQFGHKVKTILHNRTLRKIQLDETGELPDFLPHTKNIRETEWTVAPLPKRLLNRHVDIGDVSPNERERFVKALQSPAQGIQVDFDDGHCPTWMNLLRGMNNVYEAVHGLIDGVKHIEDVPVLMMRPRAWNMTETHMMVAGRDIPAPLFDFGLLMFHNALELLQNNSGPFFYLSKVECHQEAALWNEIFVWTQEKLNIPIGSIKACVLIENMLATFEMNEILHELRQHSAGLNCGIWDYSASFVNKVGSQPMFVLPDRKKYVSMDRHFLRSYMDLLVQTCHKRGCHATGGMSPTLLPPIEDEKNYNNAIHTVCSMKLKEINAGVDGFMVYDVDLLQPILKLWEKHSPSIHQLHVKRLDVKITPNDLLTLPKGGVTLDGLKHNVAVGLLFITSWMNGHGHFFYKGNVEDSATAEISRSQVWQWIRHGACLEGSGEKVTKSLVSLLVFECIQDLIYLGSLETNVPIGTREERIKLQQAGGVFKDIVFRNDFPEFITTYLSEQHIFTGYHDY